MFKQSKKSKALEKLKLFFLKPKPQQSHKKRNALIGAGATVAIFGIAGAIANSQDQS